MPHPPKTEERKKLLGRDVLTSHLRLRGRRRWDWQLGDQQSDEACMICYESHGSQRVREPGSTNMKWVQIEMHI